MVPLLSAIAPLHGAIVVCYGGGREWCHCRVPLKCAMVGGGGGIFLYIDNAKIGFCYLGSMLV